MGPTESDLLDLLMRTSGLTAADAQQTTAWWRAERHADEGLGTFLVRHGLLSRAALRQLEYLRRGYLTSAEGMATLGTVELQRLRDRLQAVPRPAPLNLSLAKAPELEGTKTDIVLSPLAVPANARGPASQTETGDLPAGTGTESGRSSAVAPAGVNASPPQIGSVLGKCLLTEFVGQGAVGVVYRGLHRSLNIPVAVKVLHLSALEQDASARQQLRAEARLLAQLNHPHIVRVWDFEDQGSYPYMVLEYVEGLSLAELIQQSGRLRWDRAREVIGQVARGLAAAGKLGIVHRDVKPANILLTRDGSAKLADLGLAVVSSNPVLAQAASADAADAGLGGTAAYMAPEQVCGAVVDHRADIYGLGATLYHAITGCLPFTGRSRMEVMLKQVRQPPPPPHALVPELGPAVSAVVLRMLAKNPDERFQTYEEFLDALDGLEAARGGLDSPVAAPASKDSKSKSRPSLWRTILESLTGNAGGGADR